MDLQSVVNPLNISPFTLIPTSPDIETLLGVAANFPGGSIGLVFVLFWSPWMAGIGIPAGLLLARHAEISPFIIFGLYALTDIMAAFVTHPLYAGLKRLGGRNRYFATVGRWYVKIAMLGARMPRVDDVRSGALMPALFRIGVVSFGLDIYHGGLMIAGLPVPRVLGWLAALVGDMIWFAVLYATNVAASKLFDSEKVVGVVTLVAMFALPKVAEWIFPALRLNRPTETVPTTAGTIDATAVVAVATTTSRGRPDGGGRAPNASQRRPARRVRPPPHSR